MTNFFLKDEKSDSNIQKKRGNDQKKGRQRHNYKFFPRGGSEGEGKYSRGYKSRNNKPQEESGENFRGSKNKRGGRSGRGGRNPRKRTDQRNKNVGPKTLDPNSPPFDPALLGFALSNQESGQ